MHTTQHNGIQAIINFRMNNTVFYENNSKTITRYKNRLNHTCRRHKKNPTNSIQHKNKKTFKKQTRRGGCIVFVLFFCRDVFFVVAINENKNLQNFFLIDEFLSGKIDTCTE